MNTQKKRGKQGFASMSSQRRSEIAAKGGKSAHALGRAHVWSHEEAVRAGRIGGLKSRRSGPNKAKTGQR